MLQFFREFVQAIILMYPVVRKFFRAHVMHTSSSEIQIQFVRSNYGRSIGSLRIFIVKIRLHYFVEYCCRQQERSRKQRSSTHALKVQPQRDGICNLD